MKKPPLLGWLNTDGVGISYPAAAFAGYFTEL